MVFVLCALSFAQEANAPSQVAPRPAQHRFPNNQTFVYEGEWRLFRAGLATIKMEQAGTQQRVTGTANSSGVVSLLYTVRDRFESTFNTDTFCSERIFKHTEEGRRKLETNIRFDAARRKAVLDERNLSKNATKHEEIDIPACVTDVLSGIFYLAAQPLTQGAVHRFPVNDGGKTIEVKATVEGREQIKSPVGTYNTVRVRAEAVGGKLAGRGAIWIWVSDDGNRIPVQMRSRAFWGTLTFRLSRIERK